MMACKVGGGGRLRGRGLGFGVLGGLVSAASPRALGVPAPRLYCSVVRCWHSILTCPMWSARASVASGRRGVIALAHRAVEQSSPFLWGRSSLAGPCPAPLSPAPTLLTSSLSLTVSRGPVTGAPRRCAHMLSGTGPRAPKSWTHSARRSSESACSTERRLKHAPGRVFRSLTVRSASKNLLSGRPLARRSPSDSLRPSVGNGRGGTGAPC